MIDISDLPERVSSGEVQEDDVEMASLEVIQRRHAVKVLDRLQGNKIRAAEVLGISRGTLCKILEKPGH